MAEFQRLGDELGTELSRFGATGTIAAIVAAWPAAVGEGVARNAWPERVGRDGVLFVATSGAAWAFELTQLAPEIMEKLRAALGDETPRALRFAPGKLPAAGLEAMPPPPAAIPDATPEEEATARSWAVEIEDPELREIVARAARASLARARGDRAL